MSKNERIAVYLLAGTLIGVFLMLALLESASAHDIDINSGNTINNYYVTEVTEVIRPESPTTITYGMSDVDLAKGIATAMAAGGHQFDFSTSDWQGSIVGAWQLGGDDENNASFALGKRFSESFMPQTMLHMTYTPDGDDDWLMVGGTFRF